MNTVITARDFRQNMKQYLDSASRGENVILSRGDEHYMVVKVNVNVVPEITPELQARLDAAHAELERGEFSAMSTHAEIDAYLEAL